MKKFLLWIAVIPSVGLGIPIDLERADSGFDAFTSAGYGVEHSGAANSSSGFNHWWVSFFSEPGATFDALSFSGASSSFNANLPASVLVQGETLNGDYYSQIFRLKPQLGEGGGMVTVNLNENFRNLSWLRMSGMGLNSDFVVKDVRLDDAESVPEAGPGILLTALALAGVVFMSSKMRAKTPVSPNLAR